MNSVNETSTSERPCAPTPRCILMQERISELKAVIRRYKEAQHPVASEWTQELHQLEEDLPAAMVDNQVFLAMNPARVKINGEVFEITTDIISYEDIVKKIDGNLDRNYSVMYRRGLHGLGTLYRTQSIPVSDGLSIDVGITGNA